MLGHIVPIDGVGTIIRGSMYTVSALDARKVLAGVNLMDHGGHVDGVAAFRIGRSRIVAGDAVFNFDAAAAVETEITLMTVKTGRSGGDFSGCAHRAACRHKVIYRVDRCQTAAAHLHADAVRQARLIRHVRDFAVGKGVAVLAASQILDGVRRGLIGRLGRGSKCRGNGVAVAVFRFARCSRIDIALPLGVSRAVGQQFCVSKVNADTVRQRRDGLSVLVGNLELHDCSHNSRGRRGYERDFRLRAGDGDRSIRAVLARITGRTCGSGIALAASV